MNRITDPLMAVQNVDTKEIVFSIERDGTVYFLAEGVMTRVDDAKELARAFAAAVQFLQSDVVKQTELIKKIERQRKRAEKTKEPWPDAGTAEQA